MSFQELFRMRLPHGLCVGVSLPKPEEFDESILHSLHPSEAALARSYGIRRRIPFVGGRLAMAKALEAIGVLPVPVSSTARGAPVLPAPVRGSISHKAELAVAIVDADPASAAWTVGVDVENVALPRTDISREILTEAELEAWRALPEDERAWALMARFSLKEALYKALDPYVSRFVGFHEVEVDLHPDGAATPRLFLREGGLEAELRWHRMEGVVLSTARVRRQP